MKQSTRHFYEEAVCGVVRRIAESLDEALDLAALSGTVGLSPLHFHRIFRGMLGETPLELHRRLRLERAAHQLATTQTPVTVIAFDAGFETHESFTRAFRAAYALAPSRFRQRMSLHRERMGSPQRLPFERAAGNAIHFDPAGGVPSIVISRGAEHVEVVIETIDELRLACVAHVGPRNMIGEAVRRLVAIAEPAGLMANRGAAIVAVFHGDPEQTPAAELRSSASVLVSPDAAIPAELSELRIPAGKYVRALHRGHYAGLGDSWDELMGQWLPASGERALDRDPFEIYRVADLSRPDALETDLYLALA